MNKYQGLVFDSHERHRGKIKSMYEGYYPSIALLLCLGVLLLSYHGLLHGRLEYSFLENGQIVSGYVQRAVVTLSLGYTEFYSWISMATAGMLVYSLMSRKPRWSLPSLALYFSDLVCDVSDALLTVWIFFGKYPASIALLYTAGILSLILGEIWIWLGVLRLYEQRTFK